MTCEEFSELALEFVDGGDVYELRSACARHVDGCVHCSRLVNILLNGKNAGALYPVLPLRTDLARNVLRQLNIEPRWRRWWRASRWQLGILAPAFAVACLIWIIIEARQQPAGPDSPKEAVTVQPGRDDVHNFAKDRRPPRSMASAKMQATFIGETITVTVDDVDRATAEVGKYLRQTASGVNEARFSDGTAFSMSISNVSVGAVRKKLMEYGKVSDGPAAAAFVSGGEEPLLIVIKPRRAKR